VPILPLAKQYTITLSGTSTKSVHTDVSLTFDRYSDSYPAEREKVIHQRGSVVRVRLDPVGNSSLTGLFRGISPLLSYSEERTPVI
jgi:hypothetical protein